MFPQQPFKYVCPKCGYSKTVTPKSDVINPMDLIRTCPKCGSEMDKKSPDFFDTVKRIFSR